MFADFTFLKTVHFKKVYFWLHSLGNLKEVVALKIFKELPFNVGYCCGDVAIGLHMDVGVVGREQHGILSNQVVAGFFQTLKNLLATLIYMYFFGMMLCFV